MKLGFRFACCLWSVLLFGETLAASSPGQSQLPRRYGRTGTVTVSVIPGKPANTFIPSLALGAGIDGQEEGQIGLTFTAENLKEMVSAGFRPLTYRLRTELAMGTWHWNPAGTWSDPEHQQGYWVSDSKPGPPIEVSYGYRLPRRGNTYDQANNDDYSRLDDGDTSTFWKSNPYLDEYFTGEDNALHPQWVVIDLRKKEPLNAIRVLWGIPSATRFAVQFWDGDDDYYTEPRNSGNWRTFPRGSVNQGNSGDSLLKLSDTPISARFIRIWMTASNRQVPAGSTDIRDGLGYAIGEIYIGMIDSRGRFADLIRHAPHNKGQTTTYTSSTDPWHRARDLDKNIEQPGLDMVFRSGLTGGLPMLTPVGLLFDTPENAAAELRYLKARGYPVEKVELGEEPDEQYVAPEDYGALYLQWASTLHHIDPSLQLGGPSFETVTIEVRMWPDRPENRGWTRRFLRYLKQRGRADDFSFLSFEWYPFDDVCKPSAPRLLNAPKMLAEVFRRFADEGVPSEMPMIMSEYGYSAFATRTEVEIDEALLIADTIGQFFTLGGRFAYLYGYEPNTLNRAPDCDSWGNLTMFLSDDDRTIKHRLSSYYAAWLLTHQWASESDKPHLVYRAESDIRNHNGESLVTAYPLFRPDGKWSVMLVNKDPLSTQRVRLQFADVTTGRATSFRGDLDLYQYSRAQYAWRPRGEAGYPIKSLPPSHAVVSASERTLFRLPPYSLTIIRGEKDP